MSTAENDPKTLQGDIPSGGEVTTAKLLQLQFEIARYTVTASVFSNSTVYRHGFGVFKHHQENS